MSQDNNTSDTVVNSLSSELEALKEIYLKEFQTEDEDTRIVVSVNLSPSTADLVDQQYVCLTLQLTVCKQQYPHESPIINIRNPRGLSEDVVASIIANVNRIADDRKGTNMLYHLIDFVKESLTSNNFPSDKCMICLYDFTKDDQFVVTKCFHHFHCYCLAHYIKKSEEESAEASGPANGDKPSDSDSKPCPVCRDDQDFSSLVKQEDYPPPSLSSKPIPGETVMLEEARQKQESFAPMFEKQQQQGGIINEEEEKNKFLLRTSDMNGAGSSSSTGSSTTLTSTSESGSSKQSSPVKSLESANGSNSSIDGQSNNDKSKANGQDGEGKHSEDDDKNEEWADAKPEISPEEEKETKEESKGSNDKAESDPSKSDSNLESSNKEEATNGKNESEQDTEGKDGKTEKETNKENKVKRNKSSRRNSRRNRTRSSGRRASAGDGVTTKTTNGEAAPQNDNRRNRSRRRNRTSSYDPNSYGADYRSQNYRPNNRGRPRMRGQGRNNVGYSSNGGLPSPPYKRNFGNGTQEETSNRSDLYNQESYRDRDRPGFYAARVIRPSAGNNANNNSNRPRNGTRGSEDSSKASISPQADSSELNQSTSEQEQQSQPRSRSKNKRRNRSNRNRTSSQNGRYSESDYQNTDVQQGNGYSSSNSNKMNNRQGYNYDYRSQGSYNKRTSYYNGNYPNYGYGYGGGYNTGYANGYNNYSYYDRFNGNYGNYGNYNNGNYYRQRTNYNDAPQRNNNYRSSNYRPRKRADTGQSQSSVKSNSNNTPNVSTVNATTTTTTNNSNTTETVAPSAVVPADNNVAVVEVTA